MGVGVKLFDPKQGMAHIQQRLDSREWWVILAADDHSHRLACHIEAEFYMKGDDNKYFELVMVPHPFPGCAIMAVYLAKKTLMSRAEMLKSVGSEESGESVGDMRDIITTPTNGGLFAMEWLDANFVSHPQHSLDN